MADDPRITIHPTRISFWCASVRALPGRLRQLMAARHDNRVARLAFMNTVALDDRMLDDIGVTREEVDWAASLPLHVDAADALCARVGRRRSGRTGHD